jgi:hypothetical protein
MYLKRDILVSRN